MWSRRTSKRIGVAGELPPTLESLRRLHRAHRMRVPFENLDIHLGVPIVLDVPAFVEKVAVRSRGGFCYELNGAFASLLVSLGFRSRCSQRAFTARTGSASPSGTSRSPCPSMESRT